MEWKRLADAPAGFGVDSLAILMQAYNLQPRRR
jgi:hypothetical protein